MLTQYLWIALAAAVVHVLEEVWSGFLTWYRGLLPRFEDAINIPWFTLVNTLLVIYGLIVVNWETGPVSFRFSFIGLLMLNALLHLVIGIVRRRYNPGIISALLLYLPLGGFALYSMIGRGMSALEIFHAFLIAAGIHGLLPVTLLISNLITSRILANRETR